MTATLPMFPLGSVLLPGELLPLQVFEPRYRQLVVDLLADDDHAPEFGVTLIERGHEVGGGDQRTDIGTVARIARVEAIDESRYALVAVGVRRIRVAAWLPDDPYPIAEVEDWPDILPDDPPAGGAAGEPGRLDEAIAEARDRVLATRRLAVEVGATDPGTEAALPDLGDDPVRATYRLVSSAPLGAADRYRLLGARSPIERLRLLAEALDDVDAVLEFRRR